MRAIFFALFTVLTILPACANLRLDIPVTETEIRSCLGANWEKTKLVTHYMVPLLESYDHKICDLIEGTCIYNKDHVPYLHNFGVTDEPLQDARCKNGYGNMKNCIHPCRVLAASMVKHRFGEVLFMPELVGQKCGNLERDGFEMIHDGYVVVLDTGDPHHFHERGRFDFFWGRCQNQKGGVCFEGAEALADSLSNKKFCVVWDPNQPLLNQRIKDEFTIRVRGEAIQRGDSAAAEDFDLNHAVGDMNNGPWHK